MPFVALFKDKSSTKCQDNGMTRQRQTALAVVDAFNRLDTSTVFKLRDRSCWREIYPKSLGAKPQDNTACQKSLNMLANTFKEMHMSVHEIIEDAPARKVCLWIIATGRTVSGPFTNEYVWSLEFDETGSQIIRWKEFADAISTKNLFPELMAAAGNDDPLFPQQDDSASTRSGSTGRTTENLPVRADSMVSTPSRVSSNISSQGGLSHVSSSQQSQQPLYQPQPQPQHGYQLQDGSSSPQQPGSKPTTPRPNSQLPPARSLRGVPTEIQGNGRTLGTLR